MDEIAALLDRRPFGGRADLYRRRKAGFSSHTAALNRSRGRRSSAWARRSESAPGVERTGFNV